MVEPNWETVEVPQGSFIGWGAKEGQYVTGKVLDYDPVGGTDFNGQSCPSLEVELIAPAASFNKAGDRVDYEVGEFVTVTGGLDGLKKGLRRADPTPGDLIKIKLEGVEDIPGGKTVKRFTIQVARGAAKKTNDKPVTVDAVYTGSSNDSDDPPF